MFSTMITVASMINPKSIAPSDSRLADSPLSTMIAMAKKKANGMADATTTALRRSPRNNHCTPNTSSTPNRMLNSTVLVVIAISSLRS